MDKIKRFIDISVPTQACNLRCKFCYIYQKIEFNSRVYKFEKEAELYRKALSKKRMGGVCCISICGGRNSLI